MLALRWSLHLDGAPESPPLRERADNPAPLRWLKNVLVAVLIVL
jgi:hypothetical protein